MRSTLAFGQRLPDMPLAQGAGLWPDRGRGVWVKSRGKPGLVFPCSKPSGAAHFPRGEGSLASSALPVSPASARTYPGIQAYGASVCSRVPAPLLILGILSPLSALFLPLHLAPFCCSLGFQLRCHLLLEAFPDHPAPSLGQGAASVACTVHSSPSSSYHTPVPIVCPLVLLSQWMWAH